VTLFPVIHDIKRLLKYIYFSVDLAQMPKTIACRENMVKAKYSPVGLYLSLQFRLLFLALTLEQRKRCQEVMGSWHCRFLMLGKGSVILKGPFT